MRRNQAQHLGSLLKDFIREQKLGNKLSEMDVEKYCHEVLGKTMGRYVKSVRLKEGTLYISVSSAIVKTELLMLREELRQRLNEHAGEPVVSRVVLS